MNEPTKLLFIIIFSFSPGSGHVGSDKRNSMENGGMWFHNNQLKKSKTTNEIRFKKDETQRPATCGKKTQTVKKEHYNCFGSIQSHTK